MSQDPSMDDPSRMCVATTATPHGIKDRELQRMSDEAFDKLPTAKGDPIYWRPYALGLQVWPAPDRDMFIHMVDAPS